jgi:eukaryotic-like serine/threonine-protein kinase
MTLEGLQNGRYRRLRLLGSGSMGEVYLMEDTRINRYVAIKVIRSEASPYPDSDAARDAARLFQREARAIAALDHPSILPLYDFGEEDLNGSILTYMVMPFCSDGSFAHWLSHHGGSPLLPPQDVAYFVEQAAEALQYAHDHQTLHLDVKPSNYLMRSTKKDPNRPSLLLADFGVARLSATTSSSSRTVRGTPIAMAPEQWSGSPVPATDQYAIAVMAYQLLVGRPPFLGGLEQLMYQHFHTQPQPPSTLKPHLSGTIDAVILRALAKGPEERYPSISAFASALGQAVQTLPTEPAIRSQQPDESDIRATLAISKAEALNGTSRTLTLPGGRRVTATVPPGAYDGQVIRLQNLGEPSRSGSPAGALILTIAIQQKEEAVLPESTGSAEPTVPASKPALQETLIPPPGFGLLPPTVGGGTPATKEPTVFAPPPPPSNQGVPALLSMSRGITTSGSLLSKGKIILLIGLALLLITSGIGLFSLVHANQVATNNANATTTANANATATTAAINATSTALTNAITPTANATATTPALQNLYNNATRGTPTLDDPLRDNSKGSSWSQGANSYGGNCAFAGGAYQVSQTNTQYFNTCLATTTDFSNFVFEVQMKITKGDGGGIEFRHDTTSNNYYMFVVGQDGSYQLLVCADTTCNYPLGSRGSSTINQGLNQTNLIAVIAQGSTIGLYVNHQFIDNIDDSTSSSGQIGVIAGPFYNPTEVVYSNAKVWTL